MLNVLAKLFNHVNRITILTCTLLTLTISPWLADAAKVQPYITANFSTNTESTLIGEQVDLVLHINASKPANQVNVYFFIPEQIQIVAGGLPWSGYMTAGQTIDIPISFTTQQPGEFTLEASIEATDLNQTSTTRVNIIASNQGIQLSDGPIINMRLNQMTTPQQQQYLNNIGVVSEIPITAPQSRTTAEKNLDQKIIQQFQQNPQQQERIITAPSPLAAVTTTVSGTAKYQDDTGAQHPIRYGMVKVRDGTTNAVLKETMTLSNGSYSTQVTATSVKVQVWSEDGVPNFIAKVHPIGQPTVRYTFTSPLTAISGPATTVNITLPKPVRGPPNALANDSIGARAFIVLDALTQYQVQAYGMRGSFMAQVDAAFPNGAGSPCPTISCYSPSTQTMYILREDALDWDVIGHEFFHYATNRGALRSIDNNPGGYHTGGTAIGQGPGNGGTGTPRNRDQGMRLAWSEGLATFMSVRLQSEPASTSFGMTWPAFPGVGNSSYQDTEDAGINTNMESSAPDGYGSENSVSAMLWDLTDTPADSDAPGGAGQSADKLDLTTKNVWDWINSTLPCPTCDRADRFWNAIFTAGVSNIPTLLDKAEGMALNNLAPVLTLPAEAELVSGAISPTFKWTANGDPSASHKPDRFFIAISKDNFVSDITTFPRTGTPVNTTQYQIPDADWSALMSGSNANTVFKWVVLGYRTADAVTAIPENGGMWISNSRTFTARAFHIRLTWNKLGADVDLHLRPPAGAASIAWNYSGDCAYYNRSPNWGVAADTVDNPSLDRDCITSCTEENITLDKVVDPGTYKIIAHYYRDHAKGPSTATIEIFQNGNQIFTATRTLSNTGDTPSGGDIWTAFSVNIPATGPIQMMSESNTVTKPIDTTGIVLNPMFKK